jgi:enterochelin esterase family protein
VGAAAATVRFEVPDPDHTLRAVRVYQEVMRPRDGPALAYDAGAGAWSGTIPRPRAWRIEYLLNVQLPDGAWQLMPDPGAGSVAVGPFGAKSVLELPEYRPPAWLERARADGLDVGDARRVGLATRRLGTIQALLWTTPGHARDEELPLLIALDGPELVEYADLLTFLAGQRPLHAALLAPAHNRSEEYSASAVFADALRNEIVPQLFEHVSVPRDRGARIAMGASLGGLAILHAHRRHPRLFGGLFSLSGSFFVPRHDVSERDFAWWARITRFTRMVHRASEFPVPIPVAMTVGAVEENLANNRQMAASLRRQGYDVTFTEHPDAHNWVSWRDVFDPHLPDLFAKVWG